MNIPNAVRREIDKLVPNSLQNDILAFAFCEYKNKHKSTPDIIVGTKYGEIIECCNKMIQRSVEIDNHLIDEIIIYQSGEGILYYIVITVGKLFVIKTGEALRTVSFFNDLDRFEINDSMTTGIARLHVWSKGNAVPLIFDDYRDMFVDDGYVDQCASQYDNRFTNESRRNRNAMDYMAAENEETLRKVVAMRHMIGFTSNTNLQDDGRTSASSYTVSDGGPKDWMKVVHRNRKDVDNNRMVFIVKEKKPWIKQYQKKVILGVEIRSYSESSSCDNVKMLLRHTIEIAVPNPLSYKMQMYVKDPLAPMSWQKKESNTLLPGETAILICVLNNLDFEQSSSFKISSFLEYELNEKTTLVALEDVVVRGLDVVRGMLDIYSKINELDELDFLAIISASEKTDLIVTIYNEAQQSENFLANTPTPVVDMSQILQTILGFAQINTEADKTLLAHCSSSHNPLFGVLLEISRTETSENDLDVHQIISFTSSDEQTMILVNLIYDAIPSRIVITTNGLEVAKVNIRPQEDQLSPIIGVNRMETDQDDPRIVKDLEKVIKFGLSMRNQMSLLLEYFDLCMQSMAKSKSRELVEKIGIEIDLLAPGTDDFKKFINTFEEEVSRGCDVIYNEDD